MLLSISLFSSCLKVSTASGQTCTGNSIEIDNINNLFQQKMKVSNSHLKLIDIPIYLFSDSTEEIRMSITKISSLKNFNNEEIDTQWYYIPTNGSSYSIKENQSFLLLSTGNSRDRDGNSKVGMIRIETKNLSDIQTAGIYSLSYGLRVTLGTALSSMATWSCQGEVEQVNRVGFKSLSTYKTGKGFVDDTIDYGHFRVYESNEEKRDIYVKSNIDKSIQLKFETTDLINQLDNKYRIHVNYYYKGTNNIKKRIKNNTFFTLTNGKNSGVIPVGEMLFQTEPINDSLIAGEYKAILNIQVRAN